MRIMYGFSHITNITRKLHKERTITKRWERWKHPTLHHVSVGIIGDGVDMRGDFMSFLPFVHVDDLLWVNGQHFVGVHHHAEQARIRLREKTKKKMNVWRLSVHVRIIGRTNTVKTTNMKTSVCASSSLRGLFRVNMFINIYFYIRTKIRRLGSN